MTEPSPTYAIPPHPDALPARALNLARRALELERKMQGRARVTLEIVMIDGTWLLMVARPGELERLGE